MAGCVLMPNAYLNAADCNERGSDCDDARVIYQISDFYCCLGEINWELSAIKFINNIIKISNEIFHFTDAVVASRRNAHSFQCKRRRCVADMVWPRYMRVY